jgi:hypothetical protein
MGGGTTQRFLPPKTIPQTNTQKQTHKPTPKNKPTNQHPKTNHHAKKATGERTQLSLAAGTGALTPPIE